MSTTQEQRSTTMQEPRPQGSLVRRGRAGDTSAIATMLAPSRFGLYAIIVLLALVTVGLSLLVTPWVGRAYYRFKKSGVVIWIREGVSIYMFCDRHRFRQAAFVYRTASQARAMRMLALGRANGLDESPG